MQMRMNVRGTVCTQPSFHIFLLTPSPRACRLRDDLTAAIKAAFSKQEPEPRTRFHEQFRKEADDYDKDFHRKYHDDLNTILIFVRSSRQLAGNPADR